MATINNQMKTYESELARIVSKIEKELIKLYGDFDITDGMLENNVANTQRLVELYDDIFAIVNDPEYSQLNFEAVQANNKILETRIPEIKKVLSEAGYSAERLGSITLETFQNINQIDFTSIVRGGTQTTANALFDNIKLNITQGISFKEAVAQMEKQVSEKMKQYSLVQMRTAKRQYFQEVEYTSAVSVGFGQDDEDLWIYTPDILVDKSHCECIWALNDKPQTPYFTTQEMNYFNAGIIPKSCNPRSAIRYNCVHTFRISSKRKSDFKEWISSL